MNLEAIPAELKAVNQWIIWRYETTPEGKPTKVPYSPVTGRRAAVNNPADWGTWLVANAALAQSGYSGIGFVFTEEDPWIGVDLDQKTDADKTNLQFQMQVYEAFKPTYAERSVSGTGLHFIGRGRVPSGRKRRSVEVYSSLRFFVFTGDVYLANPVTDVQAQADWLFRELGGEDLVAADPTFMGTDVDPEFDQVILERAAGAVNGDTFNALWTGDWVGLGYPSQSEADFALVDILAFYTQSPDQIKRLFRQSALGQRDKAQSDKPRIRGLSYVDHMIRRGFDRQPPPVDIDALRRVIEDQFNREQMAKSVRQAEFEAANPVSSVPPPPAGENPYLRPVGGLLGQIAYFIYQASPRPVPEVALAAAIGLMAGITGRSFNVSNTGLNHYIMLLAGTGRGKEALHTGIQKIMHQVADPMIGGCPGAMEFMGPDDIASGQALVKYLTKSSKSFVTVQGEFDLTLKTFTQRHANAALVKLKQVILKAYSRSGRGQVLEPTIYSDDAKNTQAIASPAITLVGEGTPERFYNLLDESLVADGLLPRFTMIHYDGIRVPHNPGHSRAEPPLGLVKMVAALCGQSLMLNASNQAVNVELSPEAKMVMDDYDRQIDSIINRGGSEIIAQMWNRAHLKALKLAALVAVGENMTQPIINVSAAKYAIDIVNYDTKRLVTKFEVGEVGDSESRQVSEIRRLIRKLFKSDPTIAHKSGATEAMVRNKVIPKRYLQQRTANAAAFKNDRIGAGNALNRVLLQLVEGGVIQQMGVFDTRNYAPQGAKLFVLLDPSWLDRGPADASDD